MQLWIRQNAIVEYTLVPDIHVSKLHFQEKFRKLEKRDNKAAEEEDGFSSKKIHVRSKDPSKIARQFEKSEKGKNGTRPGPKVKSLYFHFQSYLDCNQWISKYSEQILKLHNFFDMISIVAWTKKVSPKEHTDKNIKNCPILTNAGHFILTSDK